MAGVLAIDHGTKKSGFAYTDPARLLCQPLDTFQHPDGTVALLDHVATLVAERHVAVFLVGLPLAPDGSVGEREREVRAFAGALKERFPEREVCLHDEHLTTKEAEARLREAGHRGEEAKRRRDSWSAWVLLEDWLRAGEPRTGPQELA